MFAQDGQCDFPRNNYTSPKWAICIIIYLVHVSNSRNETYWTLSTNKRTLQCPYDQPGVGTTN